MPRASPAPAGLVHKLEHGTENVSYLRFTWTTWSGECQYPFTRVINTTYYVKFIDNIPRNSACPGLEFSLNRGIGRSCLSED